MPVKSSSIFIRNNYIIFTMIEDDILKDEDEEIDLKPPPEIEKVGDGLDEEPESIEELAEEEEEEEEEPFDDVNPL